MGGDTGPRANLEGVQAAFPLLQSRLVLIGERSAIDSHLKRRKLKALRHWIDSKKVEVLESEGNIEMHDTIKVIRSKPTAPINLGCKLAGLDFQEGRPSAFISAGHSGAMMASAFLHMGRLPGAERPAIAVTLPTLKEHGCVLLDVGANVDCKPEHLRDFALMGALYAGAGRKTNILPRVGILSNGEEKSKGNELTRATLALLQDHPAFQGENRIGDFAGYCEGKEIFKGQVDVVVTDGFVGNVVLKSLEGLGSAVVTILKREAKMNPFNLMGFFLANSALRGLKRKLDYAEYGAAPLLGVAGYAFISHGRSNAKAMKNALLRAESALQSRYLDRLKKEGTPE
jgi:glycerol-3-phosphate acyltransferase PlsX